MKTVIFLLFLSYTLLFGAEVTHYRQDLFCYGGQVNLRSFLLRGKPMQLSLDTETLQTSIHTPVRTIGHPCENETSRYSRLLDASSKPPYPLQNDGLTQARMAPTVTTDLCPSSKQGFEQRLYASMLEKFSQPVPITLFITGKWIKKHSKAFEQFLTWEQAHNLSITWGNHTYSHPYHPGAPLGKNFVLSPGYDLKKDTLKLEKLLIEKGVTPSVFFRFPGLVSDQKSIQTIHDLGLITIGSHTWIAKGEKIKPGSIILLHGNKNEPKGVTMFLEMLQDDTLQEIQSLPESL